MLVIAITSRHGTFVDTRPGHTLPGLLFYLDPFQREMRIPLRRVLWGLPIPFPRRGVA